MMGTTVGDPAGIEGAASWLERRIADAVCTDGLPVALAAEIDFLAGRFDPWLVRSARVSAAVFARSLAFTGRLEAARSALAEVDVGTLSQCDLGAAAWAVGRCGGPLREPLLARLDEMVQTGTSLLGDEVPCGPIKLHIAMSRAVSGDLVGAVDDLREAVDVGDRRAPLWGAVCRLELARVLRTGEAVPFDDLGAANAPLIAARTFFTAGGYRSLAGRVQDVERPVMATLELSESGQSWTVGFGVASKTEVKSVKGLPLIRHLLDHTDRVVSARELAVVLDGGDLEEFIARRTTMWRVRLDDPLGGAVSDARWSDSSGGDEFRRLFFDEGVRSRISKSIRRTIDRITDVHPLAGAHLAACITTGHACRYRPTGAPVVWSPPSPPVAGRC